MMIENRLPATSHRVPEHTARHVNEQIHNEMEQRLFYYADHPEAVDHRLEELDQEWDIERMLEANAATLTVLGTTAGLLSSRKWLILPAVVGGFLLQHALQGWCPPLPVFRRMGYRTQTEIEKERYLLKALRGDFEKIAVPPPDNNSRKEFLAKAIRSLAPVQ